jgi:hypothetical protein
MSANDVIETALRTAIKSASRRDDIATEIGEALWDAGYLTDGASTVEVHGARIPVETVEAYGLTISVDANGNAVEVSSPWGLGVTA